MPRPAGFPLIPLINIFYRAYKNNNVALSSPRRHSGPTRDTDGTRNGRDAGGDAMNATCECGMTLEGPARRTGCQECGTVGCRSCSIEVETITYCRWCATSVAPRRAA